MARVSEYRRPATLAEALACIALPGAVMVGGGTKVNAEMSAEPITVVDLQALGIDGIERHIDGLLIAAPASELLASFLVHDAQVRLVGPDGPHELEMAALLADRRKLAGRIIVAVRIETDGVTSVARTGRTRADRPIVAAVARRTADGGRRLALTGVALTPVLMAMAGDAADDAYLPDDLDPPDDFLGSSEYRRALAAVLARRALGEVG